MNQEQLNAIKERVAKATPGPWIIEESRFGSFNAASVDENYDLTACLMKKNDADFVTNAREDVPALIAEVERLMKGMHQLREYISLTKHSDDLENINGILWSIMQGGEADE